MANKIKTRIYKKHKGAIVDSKEGIDVIECVTCGFKHIVPLPTDGELKVFYEKEFYGVEKPDYFKDMEEDYDWWMATYKNWYDIFSKNTKGRRLLDIGSGPGFFLKCGQDLGWDVVGVEPSPHACAYSREELGVKTIQGFFHPELLKSEKKFDVVIMTLVLEHVPNPREVLMQAKSLLKRGGLICIMSPNDYSPFQSVLRSERGYKPWWVVPKHHLNYFDFRSMERLMKKTKLRVVESIATFPIDLFLLFGDDYINNRLIGRAAHGKRKKFEMAMYVGAKEKLNGLYRLMAKENIGREFVVIGKKI